MHVFTQTVGIRTVQDQPLFDAIAQDVTPDSSDTPLLLLDRTLRIRGCNSAYERGSRRRREELIGQAEPGDARIVAVEAALEVAGHRGQPTALARPHADRV